MDPHLAAIIAQDTRVLEQGITACLDCAVTLRSCADFSLTRADAASRRYLVRSLMDGADVCQAHASLPLFKAPLAGCRAPRSAPADQARSLCWSSLSEAVHTRQLAVRQPRGYEAGASRLSPLTHPPGHPAFP